MVSDEEMRSGSIVKLLWKFAFPTVVGVFIAGIACWSTVLLTAIYYQSINMVRTALFIYLWKIFVFLFSLLFILPIFFGLDEVGSTAPVNEYIMILVALSMLLKEFKFLENKGKTETETNSKFVTSGTLKRWKLREYPSVVALWAFGFEAGNPAFSYLYINFVYF